MKKQNSFALLKALGLLSVFLLAMVFNSSVSAQYDSAVTEQAQTASDKKEEILLEDEAAPTPTDNLITAASYPFAALTGVALEDMSSDTTQLVGPSTDDNNSALTNIGFEFLFDGVRYTQFGINGNGFASLGIAPTGTSFTNNLATTTNQPKIAPFWDDLCVGTNGKVHYKTVGSAPNRKLVVEWQNMQITRGAGCAGAGAGVFQMWLFETTGVIQFVYGAGMIATATADGGYSIGMQSGTTTNLVSVTTATSTASYTTSNNTQTNAIPSGTSYTFTPNVPAAPSNLTFAPVSASSIQLNWTDNATGEINYLIYRSTDGVNYTLLATLPANTTSYVDNFLTPNTSYSYRVQAVSEGAASAFLSGVQSTSSVGNVASVAAGGNWSNPATWVGGVVPTASDNVTIVDGATVTIDTNAGAYNLTIGLGGGLPSTLRYEAATARTLTVAGSVLVSANGTFATASTGTVTTHSLTVAGSITNNNIFDFNVFNPGSETTSAADIVFVGPLDATFGGNGAVTDVRTITVNKGNSRASTIELSASNFSVQNVSAGSLTGYLTLLNGTFKISGTFTRNYLTFTSATYTIPATAGFWLNNPNYTVTAQTGSATVNGLLRVSQGTYNVGTASNDSLGFGANSAITVEGGTINTAGRFGVAAAANAITYNQTGGTITVQTVGNTSTTLAGFDMGTSTLSFVAISGGSIIVQTANTAATTPRDYRHQAGSATTSNGISAVTGGILRLGNTSTATVQSFNIQGVAPNILLTSGGGFNTATWGAVVNWNNISRDIEIVAGTTMNFGNQVFLFNGATLRNNGTITHTGASSRFVWFLADAPQNYNGNGTVTAPMTSFETQNGNTILDPTSPNIVVRRVILFAGGVVNANKLTIGNGDATVNNIQIGNTTTPLNAGSFDAAPVFNLGTGGLNISYLRTTLARTTGPEIPPSRTLVNLTYDDNDPTHNLTLAGGNLIVGSALTLTNGVISGGANTITHNGTVTRTNGYIDGALDRVYTATGAYTYHVGQNGYSPVISSITTLGANPSRLLIKANDFTLGGLASATSVSRNWTVLETGDLTASLTFTYTNADVNGNEANYKVFRRVGGVTTEFGPSTINPAANTAAITSVTDFGDFGIGEGLAAPVSAAVIAGRVTSANGQGIPRVRIVLVDSGNTNRRTALTNGFGYFNFQGVATNVTYSIAPFSKTYTFSPGAQMLFLSDDNVNINFTGTLNSNSPNPDAVYFNNAPYDFDGDGQTDLAVFRKTEGVWYILRSSDGTWYSQRFGLATDKLAPADYDGDGRWDVAVYRPTDGNWYIWQSSTDTLRVEKFGVATDVPMPSDYDGDGRADLAMWREAKGAWVVKQSSDGRSVGQAFDVYQKGLVPTVADFNGDGRGDMILFNRSNGHWMIFNSGSTERVEHTFGASGDRPVAADYDGDGTADLAVYRSGEGVWLVRQSGDHQTVRIEVGTAGENLVTGDYDGDGRADAAVYQNGSWSIKQTAFDGFRRQFFGTADDIAIPSVYTKK